MPNTFSAKFQLLCFLCLAFSSQPALSNEQVVALEFSKNITVKASYSKGDMSKPAVLLLHGFLSTSENATVKNLAEAITDAGYSSLRPTLSHGIDRRNQPMACEAIHTHSMQDDVREVQFWIEWLKKQHKDIILIGHSFGSLIILNQLQTHANPEIKLSIATSLIDLEHAVGKQNINDQLALARQHLKTNNGSLQTYTISYCKKYTSDPASFISYASWNQENILKLLKQLKSPVHIIMGGNDNRMTSNWPELLKKQGSDVGIISGANHFFSEEFEFELHDYILQLLDQVR